MWDHEPSAEAILAERLKDGWTPTASLLQAGDRVLGYAACSIPQAKGDG